MDVEALRQRTPAWAGPFHHPADHRPVEPPPEPQLCRRHFADWIRDETSVHQLTSGRELHVEGARQHNCVASYTEAVEAGDTVVLTVVVAGKRLTLSLVREARRWRVSEFKGFANRRASGEEWKALATWLTEVHVAP